MDFLPQDILELIYYQLNDLDKVCFRLCCREFYGLLPEIIIDAFNEAINLGDLGIIKFFNPERTKILFNTLAENGHLEVLKWARSEGCEWNEGACCAAARGGHLEVLQWLRDEGCPWNSTTCSAAAAGGHLEVLQWAWFTGCPCNETACHMAVEGGYLEVLKWLRRINCPWNYSICFMAGLGGDIDILQWLDSIECPCGKTNHQPISKIRYLPLTFSLRNNVD